MGGFPEGNPCGKIDAETRPKRPLHFPPIIPGARIIVQEASLPKKGALRRDHGGSSEPSRMELSPVAY